ncbi:MAG: cytidylate kinase family protein [Candidatus Diapherotrites archaeon]
MLIIISGFAGSGKSSLADSLGKKLGLKVIHASAILKEMKEKGEKALEKTQVKKVKDWWESEEAKEFMKQRHENPELDIMLDKKLMEIAEKGNVVLDSWTMPYLYKGNAYKIWLEAKPETRAKRVSERDNLNYDETFDKIKARDIDTKRLYERLYKFKMGEDLSVFNLVLKTDSLNQEQVLESALKGIMEWCYGKDKNRNKRL